VYVPVEADNSIIETVLGEYLPAGAETGYETVDAEQFVDDETTGHGHADHEHGHDHAGHEHGHDHDVDHSHNHGLDRNHSHGDGSDHDHSHDGGNAHD